MSRASAALPYALIALGLALVAWGALALLPVLRDATAAAGPPEDFAVAAATAGGGAQTPEPAPEPAATDDPVAVQIAIGGVPAALAPLGDPPEPAHPILGYEQPRRIAIPAIKLDAPVEESEFVFNAAKDAGYWSVPDRAAGWHNDSAMLGEPGNLVLSGHNNLGARVFADLRFLKPMDEIIVRSETQQRRYIVSERKLLLEKGQPLSVQMANAVFIQPDLGDDRLTLVTCWPPSGNSHRIVIIARPADASARSAP